MTVIPSLLLPVVGGCDGLLRWSPRESLAGDCVTRLASVCVCFYMAGADGFWVELLLQSRSAGRSGR